MNDNKVFGALRATSIAALCAAAGLTAGCDNAATGEPTKPAPGARAAEPAKDAAAPVDDKSGGDKKCSPGGCSPGACAANKPN
jgi:hypothetical protein